MYRSKNSAGPTMERGKNFITVSLKTRSSLLHRESQILTEEKGIEGKKSSILSQGILMLE